MTPVQKTAEATAARKYTSIIDTSSRHTRISNKVSHQLGLKPISTNEAGVSLYRVDVYLPNNIRIASLPVILSATFVEEGIDCALGMDVLSCGDISLSGHGGKTMFSFRVPAQGAADYVEEHKKTLSVSGSARTAAKISTTSATRDQPCPCGSGKKYKNCCGKLH